MIHLSCGVNFHPYQAFRASHVDLDTDNDVYLRHDALNGYHLQNINARL